jgi:hypothetical protein
MKSAIFIILFLSFFSDNNCQTNESLRNYFYPKANTADTLHFESHNNSYSDNKKVIKYFGTDTIEVLEFDAKNEFTRSYTYLIADKEIQVLNSKTNLKGKQIIENKILRASWLSLDKVKNYYDGRCEDTSASGNWEWENRQQVSFKFDSVFYRRKKRKALIVNYDNYILNQPRLISAKIFFIDFKETMTFIEEVGLVKIKQNGIDHINLNFSSFFKGSKLKKKNDYSFSNVIELRQK